MDENGNLNLDQVKRELHDYKFLLDDALEFYCAATIDCFEESLTEAYNQGYKDGKNHFYGEDCPVLKQRIEDLESTLNTLYHSTSCTTYQMELINEICPQK